MKKINILFILIIIILSIIFTYLDKNSILSPIILLFIAMFVSGLLTIVYTIIKQKIRKTL